MKEFDWADFGSAKTRELYTVVEQCRKDRDEVCKGNVEAFTKAVFGRTSYDDSLDEYLKSVTHDRCLLVGRYFYSHDANHGCDDYFYVNNVMDEFTHAVRGLAINRRDGFESEISWPDHKRKSVNPEKYAIYPFSIMSMIHPIGRLGTHEMDKTEFDTILFKAIDCIKKSYPYA